MDKLKVFIDFECVSSPFNSAAKLPKDFPYAYSIGVYKDEVLKTSTFIFAFGRDNIEDVNQILRTNIIKDVRRLSGKRNFKINMETTQFVSFAPALEKRILSKVYSGVEVFDIAMGYPISLSNATKKYVPNDKVYFVGLKKWVSENVSDNFIVSRGLDHDGSLASLTGHILAVSSSKVQSRFYKKPINIKSLMKELRIYSEDDTIRMKYIHEHQQVFLKLAKRTKVLIQDKNKARARLTKLRNVKEYLKENKKITIDEAIKLVDKETKKLEKLIDKKIK